MNVLLTDPLLPGYLFSGFVLAGIVVFVALALQAAQEDF